MPDSVVLMWRTGRSIGRTIYAFWLYEDEGEIKEHSFVIGMMDTPELAEAAVEAHNHLVVSHPANDETQRLLGAKARGR